MRNFVASSLLVGSLLLAGCSSGGGGTTTSTTGEPTTEQNVRQDYKKASMGQGKAFTTEEEAVKSLPPGYPMPGGQGDRSQGQ